MLGNLFGHLITQSGEWRSLLASFLLSLPIVLLALSVHETAHGFVAYKLGDPTAKSLGRLTLNPIKHIDPIGFICMLLLGFGWAKPVPINSRYFKKPRRDMALTALAGPMSNIAMAAIFTALLKLADMLFTYVNSIGFPSHLAFTLSKCALLMLYYGISLNITLAIFNLLPIPPLDGSRIITAFLPPMLAYKFIKYERIISIVLMVLMLLGLSSVISILTDIVVIFFLQVGMLNGSFTWYFLFYGFNLF